MSKLIDISKVPLEKTESLEIAGFTSKAREKYNLSSAKADNLNTMIGNVYKYFKIFNESNAAVVSSDIEPFKDLAILATTKFYTSNILDQICSVQTSDSPYGLITYVDFQYADAHAPDGIVAGDSIAKRSRTYGNHPTEQTVSRRIKTKIEQKPIQAGVRSIEASYTLESFLALSSIKGQTGAKQFLDRTYLDVVANKLRDEAEFAVVDAMYSNVTAEHIFVFANDTTVCDEEECQARRFLDMIEEAAQSVYDKRKIWPNVVIVGSDALKLLRRGDTKIINGNVKGTGIPSSVARNYLGVMDDRYGLLYDPELSGALLTQKDNSTDYGGSVVYTSVVPVAITPPITERDLASYRVIYTVDSVDVIHPEILARIDIV